MTLAFLKRLVSFYQDYGPSLALSMWKSRLKSLSSIAGRVIRGRLVQCIVNLALGLINQPTHCGQLDLAATLYLFQALSFGLCRDV